MREPNKGPNNNNNEDDFTERDERETEQEPGHRLRWQPRLWARLQKRANDFPNDFLRDPWTNITRPWTRLQQRANDFSY